MEDVDKIYSEMIQKYQKDIKACASSKLYINEKSFLLRTIEKLYESGYYYNNESYYKEYMHE